MDFIDPSNDPKVSHCYADLNGAKYHYLLGQPSGECVGTIFLVHGWPDLAIGWRYQIPMLLKLGYRVVCPDIMGFGGTDAPRAPPESMAFYSYKRAVDDIRELARQLGASKVILGGHDWGGAIAYRMALWYPEFVTHLFSVCTPYWSPSNTYIPIEDIVKAKWPNFRYQIHLASGEVEKHIQTKEKIRQFLNACYGGTGPNGESGFEVTGGTIFENLDKLGKTKLLSADMLEYYAEQYSRNGMHGTLCWYRSREQNFRDELKLKRKTIDVPCLFIQATEDKALPPAMSNGMEQYIPTLRRGSVATGHWALWEAPDQINNIIKEWLRNSEKPKSHL